MTGLLLASTSWLTLGLAPGATEAPRPREAFFIVQAEDLRHPRDIDLKRFAVLICNPSLHPGRVRREAAPGALLLGYVDVHQVPQWGRDQAFFQRYRRSLDHDRFYWLDADGNRKSTHPNTLELRPTPEVADSLAAFVSAEFRGWDGLFLDELWGEVPRWVLKALGVDRSEWARVRADFDAYRDRFIRQLALGPDQVLVAHVGRDPEGIAHLGLDGITFEVAHIHAPADTARYLRALHRYRPEYCITWDWLAPDGSALRGVRRDTMQAQRLRREQDAQEQDRQGQDPPGPDPPEQGPPP